MSEQELNRRNQILVTRSNGTLAVKTQGGGKSLTVQADKKMCCINNIMAKYQKTGQLPNFPIKKEMYGDFTQTPTFLEAHARVKEVETFFKTLPAEVRNAMDNKPENLVNFLADPVNKELLEKHGVLEKVKETPIIMETPEEKPEEPAN